MHLELPTDLGILSKARVTQKPATFILLEREGGEKKTLMF